MAERSHFWQTGTTGDGATTITEAQTTEWHRDLITPRADANGPHPSMGPLRGVLGELIVSGVASPVSVAAGACSAAGYYYKNDSAVSVAIPTPTGATRIDRIVIRVSHGTTRTARIVRLAGTEGSGAPPLTQTAGTTWEIPLASVAITTGGVITVTDQRVLAQFATNHVRRDGDTMTGPLTVPSLTASGGIVASSAVIGGVAPWTSANDGEGSGLDADLVAGVNVAPIRRQGGSATAWSAPGTTSYAPGAMRVQCGVIDVVIPNNLSWSTTTLTFPVAFADVPVVLVAKAGGSQSTNAYLQAPNASAVTIGARYDASIVPSGSTGTTITVTWIAIGPP